MSWPETADGDVFRRMQETRFDFTSICEIDFNVDFPSWPPSPEAIRWLGQQYGKVVEYPPSADFNGYVQFKVLDRLNYDLVVNTQDRVSREMAQYGGICESWGVMQEPLE